MRHASLFTGIGGFDLAAEWMGWENVFHCEKNKKQAKFLKQRWPHSTSYGDITKTNFTKYRGAVDVLSGGFPCQTFSLIGKGEMDMSLWKEMFRAVREIKPLWVVAENVYGFIARKRGLLVEEVCVDLENEGFTVLPPLVLPAAGVGACHRRYRVWIVAHTYEERLQANMFSKSNKGGKKKQRDKSEPHKFFEMPPPHTVCQMDDGLPAQLGLDGYGNAIVPQLAYEIFQAIQLTNDQTL